MKLIFPEEKKEEVFWFHSCCLYFHTVFWSDDHLRTALTKTPFPGTARGWKLATTPFLVKLSAVAFQPVVLKVAS